MSEPPSPRDVASYSRIPRPWHGRASHFVGIPWVFCVAFWQLAAHSGSSSKCCNHLPRMVARGAGSEWLLAAQDSDVDDCASRDLDGHVLVVAHHLPASGP